MIAFWKVLEVEEVTWRPEVETSPARTLQFSTSVEIYRQNVVGHTLSYATSRHLIFPKLGQKLEDNKWRNLTRPDFRGKIWIIQ